MATHGFHVLIDLGGIRRDSLGIGALLHELLIDIRVHDLLAHRLGRVVVLGKPLAPCVLIGKAHLGANVLDSLGNLVLGNLHPVDRGCNTTRISGRVAGLFGATDDTQGAHGRKTHRGKRFRRKLPGFNSRVRLETVPDDLKAHFPTHDGTVTTVAQFAHF